jgi:hypothetical protein
MKCKLDKLKKIPFENLTFSLDEDYWTLDSDEIEDNIHDCIEHEGTPKEEIKVYIGKTIKKTHKDYVHPKQLLSSIQEYAYDDSGEYADNYLESLSPEIINNLGKLIIDYMNEYIEQPRWYSVENWVECTVDEFYEIVRR